MKKRILALLLLVCMVITMLPVEAFAAETAGTDSTESKTNIKVTVLNPYNDVKETDWCYDAVQYARVNGFFSGTSDSTFSPNGSMTRGMFVTVLGRMAGVDTAAYAGSSEFSDVPEKLYYAPYVAWAAKYGITTGTGGGKFSPDAKINRAQMAAFYVRYFEKFDVNYDTGKSITTTPADIDSVPAYAKDAVLKLWSKGLLNGDGVSFNPGGSATRAQAAVLCQRTDEAVETWYQEPGVASTRVSVDPAQETAQPATGGTTISGGTSGGSSSGGSGSSGSGSTTYYEVAFALGSGQSETGVTLPETSTYAGGTAITSLPTPYKKGSILLGWYYDADMTQSVSTGDTVNRNLTLYAKMAESAALLSETQTVNYITKTDAPTTFTFGVKAQSDAAVRAALTLQNVTDGNAELEYELSGSGSTYTVSANLEAGQTYKATLPDDSAAVFVYEGEA